MSNASAPPAPPKVSASTLGRAELAAIQCGQMLEDHAAGKLHLDAGARLQALGTVAKYSVLAWEHYRGTLADGKPFESSGAYERFTRSQTMLALASVRAAA